MEAVKCTVQCYDSCCTRCTALHTTTPFYGLDGTIAHCLALMAGRVKILDQVKNVMKLAQGEYVALEKIENMYSSSPLVVQLYVHSDGLHAYLGVLVPDPLQLAQVASSAFCSTMSERYVEVLRGAVKHPKVNQAFLTIITKEAKAKNSLKGCVFLSI